MLNEIWVKVVLTVVGTIATGLCGYLSAKVKEYRKKIKDKETNENVQNKALLYLLQNQLTNTFYVYNEIGEITDYVLRNWINSFKIYKQLGGNDYVDTLKEKMMTWKVVKTDILEKEIKKDIL